MYGIWFTLDKVCVIHDIWVPQKVVPFSHIQKYFYFFWVKLNQFLKFIESSNPVNNC